MANIEKLYAFVVCLFKREERYQYDGVPRDNFNLTVSNVSHLKKI